MKLSTFKDTLTGLDTITFFLPDETPVPSHFHVTEVGLVSKHFIDCGGTTRHETKVNFQLWTSTDYDHRLSALKLREIIELSEKRLFLPDAEIEVEYQGSTIGKYGIEQHGEGFILVAQQTDCLAKDNCGIPVDESEQPVAIAAENQPCTPGSGCC